MTNNGKPEKIDILIDQVGHLTEGLTELKLLIHQQVEIGQQQANRIDQLANAVSEQSQSIKLMAASMEATSQNQSEAIKQLVGIVNDLLHNRP